MITTAELSLKDRAAGALYGLFIGDALAMPVHWYYNTRTLKQDYGQVTDFLKPRNPHPDSILWRSSYVPQNAKSDILHDQSQYWGKRGIHYHQFLKAGENTLNLKLALELLRQVQKSGVYSRRGWLSHMVTYMTSKDSHNDTYVEEYLRHFFTQYGNGVDLLDCGRKDENHIGGLSLMIPILILFAEGRDYALKTALTHLGLTHGGPAMHDGGTIIANIILDLLEGRDLGKSVHDHYTGHLKGAITNPFESLFEFPDETVVGKYFSSACYMDHAVPATLFLALKYADSPEQGLIANTMCGGDNAGRGAVLGTLLGAVNGLDAWPERWVKGLLHPPELMLL